MKRLDHDQGYLHPKLVVAIGRDSDMSRLGIKPGPPRLEASTLEKSHLNWLLIAIVRDKTYILNNPIQRTTMDCFFQSTKKKVTISQLPIRIYFLYCQGALILTLHIEGTWRPSVELVGSAPTVPAPLGATYTKTSLALKPQVRHLKGECQKIKTLQNNLFFVGLMAQVT